MDTDAEHKDRAWWFGKGLKFECRRCGACCRGEPGYVWVCNSEVMSISGYLQMSVDAFCSKFVRQVDEKRSLVEKPNGDCILWESGIGCRIYPLRPTQCRTFPFWRHNLADPQAWEDTARRCAGIGQGKLFTLREILKNREKNW